MCFGTAMACGRSDEQRRMEERAFGDVLRELRIGAGLSQEALAESARLSPGAISALERGARRGPQHQTLSLIAEALQLDGDRRANLERAAGAGRRRAVRGGHPAGERREDARTNVPPALTSFHGRDDDLVTIEGLLATRRLVTLLGPGGVGKTRLALEAARRRAGAPELPDGVWFVDLSFAPTSDSIASAVARPLGVHETAARPLIETLCDALAAKKLLLVLDNCERAADAVAHIVEAMLRAAPGLAIVATTREALRVDGECVVRVDPLPVEIDGRRGPALELFFDRLADADVAAYGERRADQIELAATICTRLDGLPLALELAAGRARDLSLAQIASGLEERFALLAGGRRTASPRQATLHGAIAWSYEPLEAHERTFFSRLGSFADSFTSESAIAVCGEDVPQPRDALVTLIAKSLVAVVEDGDGRLRYRLLESMRAFARDRLDESGDRDRNAARFARHFLDRARSLDERFGRVHNNDFVALAEPDLENFRAALEWSLAAEGDVELGADLAGAMGWVFRQTTHFTEGIRWAELALSFEARLHPATIGRLRMACCYFHFNMGGMKTALDAALAAEAAFRSIDAVADVAGALTAQAYCAYRFGDTDELARASAEAVRLAREAADDYRLAGALNAYALTLPPERSAERVATLEEAIRASRAYGDADAISPLSQLATAYHEAGEFEKAAACGREILAIARKNHNRSTLAAALVNLAASALALDDTNEAASAAREGLELIGDLGTTLHAMCALQHLGTVAARTGEFARAARLCGASDALYRDVRFEREPIERRLYDRTIAEIRSSIGDAAFAEHLHAGEALPIDVAVAEALA